MARTIATVFALLALAPVAIGPATQSLSTTGRRRARRRRDDVPGELSDAGRVRLDSPTRDRSGELSEVVRVRLDSPTLARLDRVVAFAQGMGEREANRSFFIRDALDAYLAEIETDFPEITRKADTSV